MSINKIAIVGAGIFGCSIALELDKEGYEIVLFEKEEDIMLMASKKS
jgi:L-2-hydroxyglutarate oxidase LhgO